MKFDIFSKQKSKNGRSLKHYIPNCKKYDGDDIFVTIWNDLNTNTFLGDIFAEMTYAYARRSIAAFLYLQGHFNAEEVMYQHKVFQVFQHKTNASVEFQEETAAASNDFLAEYSNWFTKERVQNVVAAVIRGQVVDNKSIGNLYSADIVIDIVDKFIAKQG